MNRDTKLISIFQGPQTRKTCFEIGSLLRKDALLSCRRKSLVTSPEMDFAGEVCGIFSFYFIFDYYSVYMKDQTHKGLWVNLKSI